jgi:hypothetical protein
MLYGIDPNAELMVFYFNAIHDGRALDEATGKLADVRDLFQGWDLDRSHKLMLGMFDVNLDRVLRTTN